MNDAAEEVVVRTALDRDVRAILALWEGAGAVRGTTDDPASIRRLLARDPDATLIAELDGRIVGTLIVGWDGWRAGLYRLVVLPRVRRRGIGALLVRAAEQRLRVLGARRVAAIVIAEHDHAVGFWEAMGYRHDARVHRYVRDLDDG